MLYQILTAVVVNFAGGLAFGLGMIVPSYYMGRRWGHGCNDGQR